MKWILNSAQMKSAEWYTIEEIGIPSLVLMERAALCVAVRIKARFDKKSRICVVCGSGNNGADGVAVARILSEEGYQTEVVVLGKPEKFSKEMEHQLAVYEKLGHTYKTSIPKGNYDCFVDAIFGIGLKRNITDEAILTAIDTINLTDAYIYSVDIPSGICTDDGSVMGKAVCANETITFSYEKPGLCLYPGKEYAGKVFVEEIGVRMSDSTECTHFGYDFYDGSRLLKRAGDSHKGTFGKVAVIAGNEEISGAAVLCAKAAFACGVGMIKVLSEKETLEVVKNLLPEAMTGVLTLDTMQETITKAINWADCVVIGPGIGTDNTAYQKMKIVLENFPKDKKLVIDADGLNLLAEYKEFKELTDKVNGVVYTPHMMELARMTGYKTGELKASLDKLMTEICTGTDAVYVCKDSVTKVYQNKQPIFINRFGNAGMATAGSGDVLSGILGAMLSRKGADIYEAVTFSVHLHSLLGDEAAKELGLNSMRSGDMITMLPKLVYKMEEFS